MPATAAPELLQLKGTLSRKLRAQMKNGVTISALAKRMGTGRTAVRRVLDPHNTSITLHTMFQTARALGMTIKIETKPLSPKQLVTLADQLPAATTPKAAAKLKKQLLQGFYGDAEG